MRSLALERAHQLLIIAIIVLAMLWVLFPFYWAFVNSIKQTADAFQPGLIPFLQFDPTFEHWQTELAIPETQRAMLTSIILSTCAATIALVLGTPAAYALVRFRFTWISNAQLMIWFLAQRMIPPVVMVIPLFLIMRELYLLDSIWALVLLDATFTLPFPVIIMSQMFRELPIELEEAARIDGASPIQEFAQVALPLVTPGLVAAWIICLAFSWNEFLFAKTLTTESAIPLSAIIGGAEHYRGVLFWYVGQRVLLMMLPPVLLTLLAQRYIVRGLTLGAVKG
jgi:multiple sugar transport system permease protein